MTPINVLKEQEVPGTPLLLFDCTLPTGDVQSWSTHNVAINGTQYLSRVLKHNLFELNNSVETATNGTASVSITLANADAFLSPIERNVGWKGSSLVVTFLFYDLKNQAVASDSQIVFRGIANPPEQSTEATLRLSFTNRFQPATCVSARPAHPKDVPLEFSDDGRAEARSREWRHPGQLLAFLPVWLFGGSTGRRG